MNITVNYTVLGQGESSPPQAYGLEVEVTSAVGMSDKIFVFQRNTVSNTDPQTADQVDEFVSLADPVDLVQYPEDAPDLANGMPYYRKNTVLLLFRSMVELDETRTLLDADIAELVRSLNLLEGQGTPEEVVYG